METITAQPASTYIVQRDFLGPRFIWDFEITEEDERMTLELYAGEWTINYDSLGEDCCWHGSTPWVVNVGKALDHALGKHPVGTVSEIAGAHLKWAEVLGSHKGAAMRRSLNVQLAKRGLRLA
jgi:hypothetical protein